MKAKANKPHFHVTAGLIRQDGKLLIARRPAGGHLAGLWEFPGGKQEAGETLEAWRSRLSKPAPRHMSRVSQIAVEPGSTLEKRLQEALTFGVDWSAEHVRTGKTWAEVATTLPAEAKEDKD